MSASSSSRCPSRAFMRPMRRRPIRSARNSTARPPITAACSSERRRSTRSSARREAKAVEVGTKWELFDRRLLATGALFQTDVSNAREFVPTGFLNAGTIVAGAAYRVQGIDLGVAGKITDKWSIFGGLVLMNTRVDPIDRADQYRSAARHHRPPVVQPADEISSSPTISRSADRRLIDRKSTAAPARRQSGHRAARTIGASTPSSKARSHENWTMEAVRQQHLQQALLRRLLSERGAVCPRSRPGGPLDWTLQAKF